MKNYFVTLLMIFSIILTPSISLAKDYHIFLSVEKNYTGLSALRAGIDDWEAGQLVTRFYGINKIFRSSKYWYTSLGFGLAPDGGPGFFAAAGFDLILVFGIGLRGELYAGSGFAGHSEGAGTLGLSWHF